MKFVYVSFWLITNRTRDALAAVAWTALGALAWTPPATVVRTAGQKSRKQIFLNETSG